MPLRDHFRPPLANKHSWDALHGGWPMVIVQRLHAILPEGYAAAPGVHLTGFEIDVSAYELDESDVASEEPGTSEGDGGVAVAAQPALSTVMSPTLTVETDLPDQEEYEVRVYDTRHERTLVAAIEIVSPANKDRPESRAMFVAKCAALLQQGVCVSVVDVVTTKQFNLYADLLEMIGVTDPALGAEPPPIYAVTLRGRKRPRKRPLLDGWLYPLALGHPLPPLPLWLNTDLSILVELDASYEDACRVLRIA